MGKTSAKYRTFDERTTTHRIESVQLHRRWLALRARARAGIRLATDKETRRSRQPGKAYLHWQGEQLKATSG